MKKNYKKIARMSNAVEEAAPQKVWGKGVAGKGGKTNNSYIGNTMFHRELNEKKQREA